MGKRIPPSGYIKQEISTLFNGGSDSLAHPLDTFIRESANRFKDRYTADMECLEKDLEECLTYLKFPKEHYRSIRTTNLLERAFGEGRRRTKVIPRFPNETACLKLVYATLIMASNRWHGIKVTPDQLSPALTPAAAAIIGDGNGNGTLEPVAH